MIIRNIKNKKHAEAIIQYCKDNGMEPESTAGLWNHLLRLFKKMEKYEERVKAHLPTNAMRFVPGVPALSQTAPNGSASHSANVVSNNAVRQDN